MDDKNYMMVRTMKRKNGKCEERKKKVHAILSHKSGSQPNTTPRCRLN